MSCRKPILMVIDGVSRQLVEEARCGIYAEPENAGDIAAKIQLYMSYNGQLQAEGMNGYQYARRYFDRTYLAKTYLTELAKVAKT
jgi:glycosyltransferase involved in cell wall biosynthesis